MLRGPISFVKGMAFGAGMMYLFDPIQGRRRRALMRDKAISVINDMEIGVERALRDVSNRMHGTWAEVEHTFYEDHPDDRVVSERVRAEMGRHVSHPGAVQVSTHDGCVVLSGAILANEVDEFLRAVSMVRGVKSVENQLEVHSEPGNISSLQGPGRRPTLARQMRLRPAGRLMMGGLGTALMLNCLTQRGAGGLLLGTLGFGMLLRATSDIPVERIVEQGAELARHGMESLHLTGDQHPQGIGQQQPSRQA